MAGERIDVVNRWVLRIVDWEEEKSGVPSEHELLSFTHGLWTPSAPGSDPEIQDVSLVLAASPALPALIRCCTDRTSLKKIVLEMREERGRETGLELTYELYNARVASIRPGGSSGSRERPLFELGLTFEQMKVSASELDVSSSVEIQGFMAD